MQLRGGRTGLIVALATVAAAALTVAALGRPARPSALASASPADQAAVGVPPDAVTLTFTDTVVQAHVSVSGGVTRGAVSVNGRTVTQPVSIDDPGRYVVAYHVVTRPNTAFSGTLTFTVGSEAGAAAAPPTPAAHHGGRIDGLTAGVLVVNVLVVLVLGIKFVRRRHRPSGSRRTISHGAG